MFSSISLCLGEFAKCVQDCAHCNLCQNEIRHPGSFSLTAYSLQSLSFWQSFQDTAEQNGYSNFLLLLLDFIKVFIASINCNFPNKTDFKLNQDSCGGVVVSSRELQTPQLDQGRSVEEL